MNTFSPSKASATETQYDLDCLESEETFFAELLHQANISRQSCIHCVVTAVDTEKNRVSVQPLPNRLLDNGKEMTSSPRPIIKGMPIMSVSHGGYKILHPIFVGDTGYLIAADRSCAEVSDNNSTELYGDDKDRKLNKGNGNPDNFDLTSYTNGFFIPCSWAKPEAAEDESGCFVIKGIGKSKGDDKWQRIVLSNEGKIVVETNKRSVSMTEGGIVLDSDGRKISVGKDSIEIESDNRKITIGKDGIMFSGETEEKLTLLTGIRYNVASHQLQVKCIPAEKSGNMIVNVGKEVGWNMIGGGQAEELVIE